MEQVEKIIIETESQIKRKNILNDLMSWMKVPFEISDVRPTVTSNLQFSQNGEITKIQWMPLYCKIDEKGILHDIPEDSEEKDLNWQFITSSEDGSIAFWDLKLIFLSLLKG